MLTRIAIMGLGEVVKNIHLPAFAQLRDEVTIVAGCDIDSTARERAQTQWRLAKVFEDPRKMIEETHPDVVSICTPPHLHHKQTLMALDYGCHVICEKPMAESLSQADEIIQASEASQRIVLVNSQFPYMNIHMSSKELIGSPEFGQLLFLHASQTFRPTEVTEAGWRSTMQRRLCLEFGVHVFELIRFFFEDTPSKIFAHIPRPKADIQSEAVNVICVEFSDGRAASVVLDRLSKGPERYLDMRLDGDFSSIHTSIGGEVRFEIGVHPREKRPFWGLHLTRGGKAVLQNGAKSRVIAREGMNPFASATAVHFRNFLKAIRSGVEPAGSAKDHRNTLALALAAYDSASAGEVLEMRHYLENALDAEHPDGESHPRSPGAEEQENKVQSLSSAKQSF